MLRGNIFNQVEFLFTRKQKSAIISNAVKTVCASGSTDRASDSGSEGWGFESLLACQLVASDLSLATSFFVFCFDKKMEVSDKRWPPGAVLIIPLR
jgi:hypothetical protein